MSESEIKNEIENEKKETFFGDVKVAWEKQKERSAKKREVKKADREAARAERTIWARHKRELIGGVVGAAIGAGTTYYALNKDAIVEEADVPDDIIDVVPVTTTE